MHLEILRSDFPGLLTDIFWGPVINFSFILSMIFSRGKGKGKSAGTDSEREASDTGLKWVIYGPFLFKLATFSQGIGERLDDRAI